jgi:hypothetical protein
MTEDHLCWVDEPWFAWDVWSHFPGADELFELMLNGGSAWVPHQVNVENEDYSRALILPSLVEIEPSIRGSLPMFSSHGLWIAMLGETEIDFDPDEPGEYRMAAQTKPLRLMSEVVEEAEYAMFRPWEVLPQTEEQSHLEDVVTATLNSLVNGGMDNITLDGAADELLFVTDVLRTEIGVTRSEWHKRMFEEAGLHDCAQLMVLETSRTRYSKSKH